MRATVPSFLHRRFALFLGVALSAVACGGSSAARPKPATGPALAGEPIDRSRCSDAGKRVVTADANRDKKPDIWRLYAKAGDGEVLACRQSDLNFDGKIDLVQHFNPDGSPSLIEADVDFDGKFDRSAMYKGGKLVREDVDTGFDGRPDLVKYYEGEKLARIELDTSGDGRVDQWEYYEDGRLDRIGYDTTGSGKIDKWDRAPEASGAAGLDGDGAPPAAEAAAAPAP